MTSVIRLRISELKRLNVSRISFSTSTNFNTGIISGYYNVPNISISASYVPKRYNGVIYNPVMNNY